MRVSSNLPEVSLRGLFVEIQIPIIRKLIKKNGSGHFEIHVQVVVVVVNPGRVGVCLNTRYRI